MKHNKQSAWDKILFYKIRSRIQIEAPRLKIFWKEELWWIVRQQEKWFLNMTCKKLRMCLCLCFVKHNKFMLKKNHCLKEILKQFRIIIFLRKKRRETILIVTNLSKTNLKSNLFRELTLLKEKEEIINRNHQFFRFQTPWKGIK